MAQMPRTVLVSEGDTPLAAALSRLLAARGYRVVLAVERASGRTPAAGGGPLCIPWNRRSPLSARTVFLDTLNAAGSIDEVLVLEPACPAPATLAETGSVEIERAFDDARGPVFLAREALAHFKGRGGGVLGMVSGGLSTSPLECGVRECFRGVAGALMGSGGTGGLIVNGFQSGGASADEYAAFIDRTLEEKARKISGRWFACGPRGARKA